ncbi:restriction endonuclease subunit S [Alkalinema pantanalense CENA528]|uniref:restriction endonuclease subunit S n=1 Tax=Alkalinema pantanalense TaxID=1620705 RepID=UPI003D6F7110
MMLNEILNLPEGWEWTKFEDVTINYDGQRVPVSSKERESRQGEFPYYGASGIIDYVDEYLFDGEYLLIAEDGANLLSRSTPIAFEAKGKFWVNNHAHVVQVVDTLILSLYLRNYINYSDLRFYISGSAQPKLNQKNLNSIAIPLPPLNEQKRIVAKIEELRSKTQKAREALEVIPELCDRFRQSVLAAAFRGDLTADWREQNPDVEPCKTIQLGDIILGKPRNGLSLKAVDYPTPVKSFSLSATTSGEFRSEYFKYLDCEVPEDSHLWLYPGDILIQRSNTLEYVGISAIYTGQPKEFIYPDLTMKIQVRSDIISPEFLNYMLASKYTREYFKNNATGTAGNMPKINQKVVMETPIPVFSIKEQREIVQRIKSQMDYIQSIQDLGVQEQLIQLDRAILSKAFRGELVPQDPTDEPASVLLERIRTERANATPKPSKTRKKAKP